jgi:hypothetical protein
MDFKKIGYKILTYIPGVGLAAYSIKQYKTRKGKSFPYYDLRKKEDLKALGGYALEVGWFALAIGWKVYFGNGIATKEWNIINQFKNYTEKREERKTDLKKDSNLEKTVNYEELLR